MTTHTLTTAMMMTATAVIVMMMRYPTMVMVKMKSWMIIMNMIIPIIHKYKTSIKVMMMMKV